MPIASARRDLAHFPGRTDHRRLPSDRAAPAVIDQHSAARLINAEIWRSSFPLEAESLLGVAESHHVARRILRMHSVLHCDLLHSLVLALRLFRDPRIAGRRKRPSLRHVGSV